MADELNGHALPIHHTNPYKKHFTVLWSVTLQIGALTKLGLFFPVLCFVRVFDHNLAEQLHRGKRLLFTSVSVNNYFSI